MQFSVAMSAHDWFLDRRQVIEAVGRANIKALSKAGAFIRKRSRTSLRRRKKTSSPGNPPSVHSNDSIATLKNILFAYEPQQESLVVGPVKLNQREQSWIDFGQTTVPQLLEFGDVALLHEWSWDGGRTWSRRDKRVRHASRHRREVYDFIARKRRAVYKPRPFMGPALEAEQDRIPEAWAGSV